MLLLRGLRIKTAGYQEREKAARSIIKGKMQEDIPTTQFPEQLRNPVTPEPDRKQCPCCKKGRMEIVMSFKANAPPWLISSYIA